MPGRILAAIARTFRRWSSQPGWTAAVVATLALGIGGVVAIYAFVDAVVLRPLPFPDSERVVALCETAPRVQGYCVASPPNVADWARASRSIDRFGIGRDWPFTLQLAGERVGLHGGIADGGLFEVLGARAAVGRLLADTDLAPSRRRVAVLSWELWSSRFGLDPSILGRDIEIDDAPRTVVGVLARDTELPGFEGVEVWLPLTATTDDVDNRSWRGFTALGRLAPDVTLAAARSEMEALRAQLEIAFPADNQGWGLRLERLRDRIAGPLRPTLWLLLAAVGLLLLIACVNVAHLLLAQATRRGTELAVRAALGGGRRQLTRQLLAESLALASAGALLGIAGAAAALELFRRWLPPGLPRVHEVGLDLRVILFALALTLLATVGSGLLPAWRAGRVDLGAALRGGRGSVGAGARARQLLVVGEVALALTLLMGAALLGRGFARLATREPGLPVERLVTVWLNASPGAHPRGDEVVALFERVAEEARALPGVEAAALASAGPFFGGIETATLAAEGGNLETNARWFDVSPGFFSTLGLPILRGRDFEPADDATTLPVALVNRTLASRLWPGGDPIGRTLRVDDRTLTVVGEVADLPTSRPDEPRTAELYWPKRQSPRWGTFLVLRSAPGAVLPERALAARVAAAAPDLSAGGFRTLSQQLARTLVRPRFVLALLAGFAAVAVALAMLGTYGVLAYSVASRRREIGVRLALGASPARIVREIVARGLALTLAGILLGTMASLALGSLLAGFLYGIRPSDPIALPASALIFLAVAAAACTLPARRAARIDPTAALRAE